MAVRPFNPTSFTMGRNFHVRLVEARLKHCGEYVYHLPCGLPRQAVVMNYQFIPIDATINNDYILNGTNHKLYGHIDHFDDRPKLFHDGNSAKPKRGSKFEIRGIMYNVKLVNINHNGALFIELVRDKKCKSVRPEFCEEIDQLLCHDEPGEKIC